MFNFFIRLLSAIVSSWREEEHESHREALEVIKVDEQLEDDKNRLAAAQSRELATKAKLVEAEAKQTEAMVGGAPLASKKGKRGEG